MRMKIINECDRSVLNEGRNYGIGFAFLKPGEGNTFTTVQPISPCKDYLNDVVYSEHTGRPFSAYGLHTTKKNIFDGDAAYMAMSICKKGPRSLNEYASYGKDQELLMDNVEGMLRFINEIDRRFDMKPTEIKKIKTNMRVAVFDKRWTTATYLISLYTLMLRIGLHYKGECSPIVFMRDIDNEDSMMVNSIKEKLFNLFEMKKNLPVQNMNRMVDLGISVHNHGIVEANFSHEIYE